MDRGRIRELYVRKTKVEPTHDAMRALAVGYTRMALWRKLTDEAERAWSYDRLEAYLDGLDQCLFKGESGVAWSILEKAYEKEERR